MKTSRMLMVTLLLAPLFASAHNFQLQQRVAPVGVSDKGELNYADGNLATRIGTARSSVESAGDTAHCRPQLRQRHDDPLIEAIKKAKLPHDRYQTTTIVNTDDA